MWALTPLLPMDEHCSNQRQEEIFRPDPSAFSLEIAFSLSTFRTDSIHLTTELIFLTLDIRLHMKNIDRLDQQFLILEIQLN
jgi:hypothetical protein